MKSLFLIVLIQFALINISHGEKTKSMNVTNFPCVAPKGCVTLFDNIYYPLMEAKTHIFRQLRTQNKFTESRWVGGQFRQVLKPQVVNSVMACSQKLLDLSFAKIEAAFDQKNEGQILEAYHTLESSVEELYLFYMDNFNYGSICQGFTRDLILTTKESEYYFPYKGGLVRYLGDTFCRFAKLENLNSIKCIGGLQNANFWGRLPDPHP